MKERSPFDILIALKDVRFLGLSRNRPNISTGVTFRLPGGRSVRHLQANMSHC